MMCHPEILKTHLKPDTEYSIFFSENVRNLMYDKDELNDSATQLLLLT